VNGHNDPAGYLNGAEFSEPSHPLEPDSAKRGA
jgi:hypothetical protein